MDKGMLRITVVCCFFLLLGVGCASLPSQQEMAAELKGFTLPVASEPASGLVYVVRPDIAGNLVRFNVYLDDEAVDSEMGYTRPRQYIYFHVTPGKHKVFSKAENWADVEVDVRPGGIVFVKQSVELGFLMARNSLEVVDDTEGKYYVKQCEEGKIIKTKK
jgi:hypothetical protein